MPIISESFGKLTIINAHDKHVNISTAREDLFRFSTIISVGEYPDVKPIAKVIYKIGCSAKHRQQAHSSISSSILVGFDEQKRELKVAIEVGCTTAINLMGPIIKEIRFGEK